MKRIFNKEMGIGEKFKYKFKGKGERIETDGIEMHEWIPHR